MYETAYSIDEKIIDIPLFSTITTNTTTTTNRKNKKRIITTSKKWSDASTMTDKSQLDILLNLSNNNDLSINKLITQQIKQKISSYRYQDQLKGIFDPTQNIKNVEEIVKLLIQCEMSCFYCKKTVTVIYENVCDPGQWTLERIDNGLGHNVNNVCISCLKCNIGRRTMHQKRYIFTKKCTETVVELENHY
jgi:hypothetical protein